MAKGVFLRPCPICNGEVRIASKKEWFEEHVEKTGFFCIHLECDECNLEMWQNRESNWDEAVKHLADKWNRRFDDYETED